MARNRAQEKRSNRLPSQRMWRVKTALVCVLIGVLLAIPIPFANTVIGYFPLIAYLFVLLLCWVYVRVLHRWLVYEQVGVGAGCLRGDNLNFKFVVRNQSVLTAVSLGVSFYISDLFGNERESVVRSVSLPPRASKTFDFAVKFDHIGTYGVGIRQVDCTDPFGIFHKVTWFDELQQVAVQPRLCQVANVDISTDASKESTRAITTVIDDGMDYHGVREYRWGDPIKSIHWKLSARSAIGEYFTRLYETSRNPGIALFIDCDAPEGYSAEMLMGIYDALVESALSIEEWGSSLTYETELLFVDATGRRRRFEGPLAQHYGRILKRLPRIAIGDGKSLLDLVRTESSSIYSQDNLIVCSSHIDDQLVGELMRVKAGHRTPFLVAVVPTDVDAEADKHISACISRLSVAGIACQKVHDAAQLQQGGGA